MSAPKLHFFCGLIGSGKSTLAKRIAAESDAVLVSEDVWLDTLWPGEIKSIEDYAARSRRLKAALWPHVRGLLRRDVAVVQDFPANTPAQRNAFRDLIAADGAAHVLNYLDTPAEVCRARLAQRNASGGHPFAPTQEDFEQFARYFEPPAPDEGFNVVKAQV